MNTEGFLYCLLFSIGVDLGDGVSWCNSGSMKLSFNLVNSSTYLQVNDQLEVRNLREDPPLFRGNDLPKYLLSCSFSRADVLD